MSCLPSYPNQFHSKPYQSPHIIPLGWGLQPNSEYRDLFNYWLAKLDESGLKDNLWHRWTYEGLEDFEMVPAEQLSFDTVTFPFLLLIGGMFVGVTFGLFEIVAGKLKGTRANLPVSFK